MEKKKYWRDFYIVLFASVVSLGLPLLIGYFAKGVTPKEMFNEILENGFLE